MTEEHPRWGRLRVPGELRKLGFRVSLQTVRRYRKDVPRDRELGLAATDQRHALGHEPALPDPGPRPFLRRALRRTGEAHRHPHRAHATRDTAGQWHPERLVGTFRRECLDHIIVVNERHLRYVLREFVRHYNAARPHQTLELDVPEPRTGPPAPARAPIVSRPVLGGPTHECERKAA